MEKISNKENNEVKMGDKEMERKEDGSDLEQKLKKLERIYFSFCLNFVDKHQDRIQCCYR